YEAMGGEEWLTLGIFNTIGPNAFRLPPWDTGNPLTTHMSYYMIDDVFVGEHVPCDSIVTTFDTTVCTSEMKYIPLKSNGKADCNHIWSTGETTPYIRVTKPGTYWCKAVKNCHWF